MNEIFGMSIEEMYTLDSILLSNNIKLNEILSDYLKDDTFYLYALSKRKKVRFNLKECIKENDEIKISVHCDGMVDTRTYTIPSHLFDYPLEIVGLSTFDDNRYINLQTKIRDIPLLPSAFITREDISFEVPEIIYIGKSSDVKQRFRNHEKIIELFAGLQDNEELCLNLIKPSFFLSDKIKNKMTAFDFIKEYKVNKNELINFSERMLINFFLPDMNRHFTKNTLREDKVIKKLIEKYKIGHIIFDFDLSGKNYCFVSKQRELIQGQYKLSSNFNFEKFNLDVL